MDLPAAGEGDAYDVTLTVWQGVIGTTPKPLTGASVEGWAEDLDKVTVATATATITDAAAGKVLLEFPAGQLPAGALWLKARVTINGRPKTVWRKKLQVW